MEDTSRQAKIESLKTFIALAEQHPLLLVPDVLTLPVHIGVTTPPRTRKPRQARTANGAGRTERAG